MQKMRLLQQVSSLLNRRIDDGVESLLSPPRRRRIVQVLNERSRTVIPVLENLMDTGNINAALRSAEGLGFQEAHVISEHQKFRYSQRITRGAHKWMDIHRWDQSVRSLENLKKRGYKILATHAEGAISMNEWDFTRPTAILFGNEHEGVSPHALELADERAYFPMIGFSESFNVSVAVAIILHHARVDRLRRQGFHGDLSYFDKKNLRRRFYLASTTLRGRIPEPQSESSGFQW